jgi:hypothetical protein
MCSSPASLTYITLYKIRFYMLVMKGSQAKNHIDSMDEL